MRKFVISFALLPLIFIMACSGHDSPTEPQSQKETMAFMIDGDCYSLVSLIKVWVDGEYAGSVSYGGELDYEATPGDHTITATSDNYQWDAFQIHVSDHRETHSFQCTKAGFLCVFIDDRCPNYGITSVNVFIDGKYCGTQVPSETATCYACMPGSHTVSGTANNGAYWNATTVDIIANSQSYFSLNCGDMSIKKQ